MPYYSFVVKWTPLKLLGIRFYVDDEGHRWIKVWFFKGRRLGS